jgi:hypothetical protein
LELLGRRGLVGVDELGGKRSLGEAMGDLGTCVALFIRISNKLSSLSLGITKHLPQLGIPACSGSDRKSARVIFRFDR